MQTTPNNFDPVDNLRKRMLLTKAQMAELLQVSRQTYQSWCVGASKPTRRNNNNQNLAETVARMVKVVQKHSWPTPNAMAADSLARFELLKKLLESV